MLFGHVFSHLSLQFSFSFSLGAARYRLKYCFKGPLSTKQPTNQLPPTLFIRLRTFSFGFDPKNKNTIESRLQLNLKRIQKWATENGFKFSKCNTVCMHFFHLRKAHNDPVLTLDVHPLLSLKKINFQVLSLIENSRGWSGGAMVLGKLPVPGRPTIWIKVRQGPTALVVGAGGGCLDIFTLNYPFLYSFSLSLGDGPI